MSPAFVSAAPSVFASSFTAPLVSVRPTAASPSAANLSAKYGDYSYSTDKTKGHVQQYYVDKFRVATDFSRGLGPKTDADAVLGCDAKGRVIVPSGGVPQPVDPILLADMTGVPTDPRVADAEGTLYPWDNQYLDPAFDASTFADVDDASVADTAFAAFRAASSAERGAALRAAEAGVAHRVEKIKSGLSEAYLLTMEGKYEANYARLQGIKTVLQFSPTGAPQTELPGFDYLPSIGAMDYIPTPAPVGSNGNGAHWKAPTPASLTPVYKAPLGAATPELPYNANPSLSQLNPASE
jgi:hypothetical protein